MNLKWFLTHALAAVVRFGVYSLLLAICYVFGFVPEEAIARWLLTPPWWLVHPLMRLGVVVAACLAIVGFYIWNKIRDRAEALVETAAVSAKQPSPFQQFRLRLATQRTLGTGIRNAGQGAPADFEAWHPSIYAWKNETAEIIATHDEADAEWFRTMGEVPPPRVPLYQLAPQNEVRHQKAFREIDFSLSRLNQLIDRYATK